MVVDSCRISFEQLEKEPAGTPALVRVWRHREAPEGEGLWEQQLLYRSPLGPLQVRCSAEGLRELGFVDGDTEGSSWDTLRKEWEEGGAPEDRLPSACEETEQGSALSQTVTWLDAYFSGAEELPRPPLCLVGTPFQEEVWDLLTGIPLGSTVTYGELARVLAKRRGIPRMAAQAVGQAVGRNPVGIVVPCHRVVGATGSLTGYAGGLERKRALLRHEGCPV